LLDRRAHRSPVTGGSRPWLRWHSDGCHAPWDVLHDNPARANHRTFADLDVFRGHSPDAEETAGRRALLSVVDAELRKLPRDWRAAILLRHHAGYPPEEIAQILDRPSGTIKAWIHRGTRRVRAALPDDIVEGGYQ